ncbi:MAG: sigma 54-interacting transcriptional regulator [Myxococcota bacterium]
MTRPWALVVVTSGDRAWRRRIVPLGDGFTVGRSPDAGAEIVIEDKLLSRRHATLEMGPPLRLTDHGSRNGSFVDGVRVEAATLHPGSVVRLGVSVAVVDRDERSHLPEVPVGKRDRMVGQSRAFSALVAHLRAIAEAPSPVVVVGEAGSGKSLVATELHRRSGRPGPLAVVGCRAAGAPLTLRDLIGEAGGPGGYFAGTADGTLVFEEVDLLAPDLQERLADALETRSFRAGGADTTTPFSARVIVTTSANLETARKAGALSSRLYAQLGATQISIPPLRERRVDIPVLARHFLALEEPKRTLDWSPTFLEKLLVHGWPGNERALRALMRRLTMVEDEVTTLRSAHLPSELQAPDPGGSEDALRASAISVHHVAPSRDELRAVLSRCAGEVQRVADHFGKDRRHVYRWLLRHDLSAADFREPPP